MLDDIESRRQKIHRRQVAERTADDLAAFVLESIATLDAETFWKRFDALTGRPRQVNQSVSKPPAPTAISTTGCDDADNLLEEISELAEQVPERGQEFAESVLERARNIADFIEEHGTATIKQMQALSNMRDGLQRWQR